MLLRSLCRDVVLVLLGTFLGAALHSSAEPQFEMLLGQTKFRERESGTWFQTGPSSVTNNSLISSSYLIGLKWGDRLGFRLGYTRLGEYAGRDNIASVRDEDANHVLTQETCIADTGVDCPAHYSGRGRAQGIYFGPTVEHTWKGVTGLFELGLLFFRSTYDVTVCRPYDRVIVPAGQCYDYGHATGDHMTWYWGVGVSYKLFRDASAVLMYRQYRNVYQQGDSAGGDVGLTGGRTRQVIAGVSIPF